MDVWVLALVVGVVYLMGFVLGWIAAAMLIEQREARSSPDSQRGDGDYF